MKFKTSDNLIDLLVGQSLYSNPDVAMRELLQNAEDACYLQSIVDSSYTPEIIVRFSERENWVEISDNGLGMGREVFDDSFATVGASKTASPKLIALLSKAGNENRPIGQFGIGVLSCFGVAEYVEVRTLADRESPVSYRIRSAREPFDELDDPRVSRGTTLRLALKVGGAMTARHVPEALSHYVRHAHHIWIENADTGSRNRVPEQWLSNTRDDSTAISLSASDSGFLQLSEAWENINYGFDDQLVLCNAGFHVITLQAGTLAEMAIGIRGEVDARPGSLTILMNREGFQHDSKWLTLLDELKTHYRSLVADKLDRWVNADFYQLPHDTQRALQRMVLLMLRSPLGPIVGNENVERARKLVSRVLALGSSQDTNFGVLIEKARIKPPLYVNRSDDQQQVQRSFSDRGQAFSLTETVRSLGLRVSLLKLNGFAVLQAERHDYTVQVAKGQKTLQIHDFDVITDICASLGISVRRVQDAPAEDTTIGSSPDAAAIVRLFQMSSELKIQSVENMTDAIVADFNGYILNLRNDEIRRILKILPVAVGNPIRKALLSAYLALSTYNVSVARNIIYDLLVDADFERNASRTTGRYFRAYLEQRVLALLAAQETCDA